MRYLCATLIAFLLMAVAVHAATPPSATAAQADRSEAKTAAASSFNVEDATAAYMAQLSPAAKARSEAYFEGGYWLILWSFLWTLSVSWLLLGTRLSARMRDLAIRMTRFKWLQSAIYAVQYIVLVSVLSFPWTVYTDFFREHQYGLSNQNFGQWAEQTHQRQRQLLFARHSDLSRLVRFKFSW